MVSHITPTEAYQLIRVTGTDLLNLMSRAANLRDTHKKKIITYSRKVFIPLTNLCRDKCAYCTFAVQPTNPKAQILSPEQVIAVACRGVEAGCKEALFSLGEKPETKHSLAQQQLESLGYATTHQYLHAMCKLVFEETGLIPHANPGVMTEAEINALCLWSGSMGMMLENVSTRLLEAGQAHFGCPDKAPHLRLETLINAGKQGVPFTTGILIGIGETLEERVDSLFAIAKIQAQYGHIQEVIIQNFRRKSDIRFKDKDEPGIIDMLRTIAVARLILGGKMNIQAPPNLTPGFYNVYLLAGINDWGGISPITADHINPEAAWPFITELKLATEEAGYQLRERLTIYPDYLIHQNHFISPKIFAHVQPWIDEQGLVKPELSAELKG